MKEEKSFRPFTPNIEMYHDVSKDGKYAIIKVVQTFIKPISYINKVFGEHCQQINNVAVKDASESTKEH